MRLFKTRELARLARKAGLSDGLLREAIARAERGLIDAQIGRFLIKQRIARENEGKSGGFRAIVFHRQIDRAVFLHLFAKNERDNLTPAEQDAYREFAKQLADLSDQSIGRLLNEKRWIEIGYESDPKEASQRPTSLPAPRGAGSARNRRDR
jgi:hypothetical protein